MAFSLMPPWPFGTRYHDDSVSDSGLGSPREGPEAEAAPASPTAARTSLFSRLQHYDSPGVHPPSARVDPLSNQEARKPLRVFDLWRYGYMVATKSAEITGDFMSHYIWGPRRPSWGIEMTLITSFMRNANRHSRLADITTLRALMQIGGLVPLPSNAMVTPVTFRIKKRRLRGLLAEYDARETGSREISGEWVVGRRLWQRLQAEWKASHADKKDKQGVKSKQRVVLYLHGGAYYMFSAATHRLITIPLSKYIDARIFSIDYRLAPETRFPGPLHDAVSAYFRLLDDLHIPPENILVAGDSAGGGLALALLMYLRDNDYPMPSGAILMSPWVDLTMSCDSWDSNAPFDVVPRPNPNDHLNPVACYLGEEGMKKYLTHPYASPLFGSFKGLPPMLVQSGDAEVLRDEITLLAHKATLAGVKVRHELFTDAVHVFQMFPFLDTARKSFMSCRDFVRDVLPRHQSHSPQVVESAELEKEAGNTKSRLVRSDGLEVDSVAPPLSRTLTPDVGSLGFDTGATASHPTEGDDVESEHKEAVGWLRQEALPGPPPTLPQDRDGTSIDPDTHPTVPLSPPQSTASEHSFRPPLSLSIPQGQATNSAPTTAPAPRRKRFTVSYPSPSPPLPPEPSVTPNPTSSAQNPRGYRAAPALPTPTSQVTGHRRPLLISTTENTVAPAPTIRSRHRAISHPDMAQLCRDWAQGPANNTTTYKPDKSPT